MELFKFNFTYLFRQNVFGAFFQLLNKTMFAFVALCLFFVKLTGQTHFQDSSKLSPIYIQGLSSFEESNAVYGKNDLLNSHEIITENLDKIPGVQSFNMGPGNSKPAIRGLSGNRIGLMIDGLRIDNQQWQDEHGIGFIAFSDDEQKVYFGPSNSLIGIESIGGIISIEQKSSLNSGRRKSISSGFSSNDLGFSLKYESEQNSIKKRNWFHLYYGSHGDYLDGNFKPVLNSRFDLIQMKFGRSNLLKNGKQLDFNYRISVGQTGIARIFDSLEIQEIKKGDPREFEGPNHLVAMQILSGKLSENKKDGKSELIVGIISNTRIELEDYEMDGLGMQLNTLQVRNYGTKIKGTWTFGSAQNLMVQSNTNFGNSIVVPNKNLVQGGVAFSAKKLLKKVNFHGQVHWQEQFIFSKVNQFKQYSTPSLSFVSAIKIRPNQSFNIKVSHSQRAPNLHELYADGISEDAFRYDIGDPNLQSEKITQLDLNTTIQSRENSCQISAFVGSLKDFISFSNSGETRMGAPIFRYYSSSGITLGAEISLKTESQNHQHSLEVSASYAHFNINKSAIPFAPPFKTKLSYIHRFSNRTILLKGGELNLEYLYVRSMQPYFEIDYRLKGYAIVNLFFQKNFGKNHIVFYMKNCLSNNYIDPMSMLKIIPNTAPGLNIGIGLKRTF